jgi:hypothetical protein
MFRLFGFGSSRVLSKNEFFLAVSTGDVNSVQIYMEQNKGNLKSALNETDGLWRYTPLMYATLYGYSHVVRVLVAGNNYSDNQACGFFIK